MKNGRIIIGCLILLGCLSLSLAFQNAHVHEQNGEDAEISDTVDMLGQQFNTVRDTLNGIKNLLILYPEVQCIMKDADNTSKLCIDTSVRLYDSDFSEIYPDLYSSMQQLSNLGLEWITLNCYDDRIDLSICTVNCGEIFMTFYYSYYFQGQENPRRYEFLSDGWTLSAETFGGV